MQSCVIKVSVVQKMQPRHETTDRGVGTQRGRCSTKADASSRDLEGHNPSESQSKDTPQSPELGFTKESGHANS